MNPETPTSRCVKGGYWILKVYWIASMDTQSRTFLNIFFFKHVAKLRPALVMRVMQGWIKHQINLLGYYNKCHNITYPWPPSPLISICRHLCTHIAVGTLGIGLLHKQQWLCLWWVMSWQSSAHSTAGRGGHERTVYPVTTPELLRHLCRISCPCLHH